METESIENELKANYLFKFANYVRWPSSAFPSLNSALSLCIVGEDPFGAALDNAVGDQRIDSRSVVVRRLKQIGRESGCHILYVGISDSQRARQTLDTIRGTNVLTVTDAHGPETGIINFVVKDNRLRFNIDDDAADQNGLVLSSKLLSLAVNVKLRQAR